MGFTAPLKAGVVKTIPVLEKVRLDASHNQFIGGRRGVSKGAVTLIFESPSDPKG
jgi:hypothetical protein